MSEDRVSPISNFPCNIPIKNNMGEIIERSGMVLCSIAGGNLYRWVLRSRLSKQEIKYARYFDTYGVFDREARDE